MPLRSFGKCQTFCFTIGGRNARIISARWAKLLEHVHYRHDAEARAGANARIRGSRARTGLAHTSQYEPEMREEAILLALLPTPKASCIPAECSLLPYQKGAPADVHTDRKDYLKGPDDHSQSCA
jgi:hypothetical protein